MHLPGKGLCLALLVGLLACLQPALAQSPLQEIRHYSVAPQELSEALRSFARQSGVQLAYASETVTGHWSPGVEGSLDPIQALTRLLQNTGISFAISGENTLLLSGRPAGQTATGDSNNSAYLLAPLQIRGSNSAEDLPYQSAGSVNVISREQIERFRGTSVGDMFQGTAGVLIGENRNSSGLDVNIRGMQGQGRVPVIVDGARQETTVYRGYSGVASRSYVDPDLIGSVRIEKGPVITAEGTGATGGVVNMSTIGAADIIKPGKDWGIRLRGSALGNNSGSRAPVGSNSGYNVNGLKGEDRTVYRVDCYAASLCQGPFDLANADGPAYTMNRPGLLDFQSWAGSLALAKSFTWGDLVAAYAQRQQGNYYAGKNGPAPELDTSERYERGLWTEVRPVLTGATRFRAEERIANTHYESRSLLLKGTFFLSDDQSLETAWLRYDSDYGELMPSQLVWLGEISETQGSSVQADTYTARYHWQPASSDYIDLRANLWLTDTDQKNNNYAGNTDFGANESENYQRWGVDLSNRMQFQHTGSWQLDYGLAWQHEKLTTTADETGGNNTSIPADTTGRNGKRQELSLFTNLQWRPVNNLTLDAGIRFTRFESEDNKATRVQQGSSFCEDSNGDGECDLIYYNSQSSGSAPLFSALWEVTDGVQVYLRHAEALRMPSLFEGTSGFSTSPALDVNLKPEHATNREVGLNLLQDSLLLPGDRFRLKLAYFRNHIDDYLTRTSPNLWEDGAEQRFFTTRNIESAEFFGTELSIEYDAQRWYVEASGTRYHHIEMCHYGSYRRDKCSDYGIANSYINNMIPPNWHASATLGTRLLQQKLDAGIRATFMGKRNRTPEYDDQTQQGLIEPIQWHAYRLLDLYVSYSPNDTLTLDFNIDNLTDQYYLDALSLGLVPAPGRSARLSMTLNF